MGQRRLGRVALLWRIGVGAVCSLTVEGLAERQELFLGLCHHIDPAVMHLVQAVASVKAIVALIRQASRRLALIPGEPRRAEHDTAAEQVTIDALHYTRTRSDEQGENRPQGSQSPGGNVRRRQLPWIARRVLRPPLGAL